MARDLHARGEVSAARLLVERAQAMTTAPGAGVRVHVPGNYAPRSSGGQSGIASARARGLERAGQYEGLVDAGGRPLGRAMADTNATPLQKALALAHQNDANAPQATQIRLSASLATLGAYNGLVEPAQIANASFAILKLAARLPLIQAIINTRVNQVMAMEWKISMRSKGAHASRAARKQIELLTELVQHGGFRREPDRGGHRVTKGELRVNSRTGEPGVWDGLGFQQAFSWRNFAAAIVRDRLSMGMGCFRIESGLDKEKYPVAFFRPVASHLVRRALAPLPEWGVQGYQSQMESPVANVAYVELDPSSLGSLGGQVLREYKWDEMGVLESYPCVDALNTTYPYCEVEHCLELMASHLNADRFAAENYDNNHIPLGIVSIIGSTLGEEAFFDLQSQIAKGGGMGAFYRLLYLHFLGDQSGAGVNFTPLKSQSGIGAELQWALQYQQGLRDQILGVFQMNPEELGGRGQDWNGPKLSQGGPDASIAHSKDKGLEPLVGSLGETVNKNIVWRFDDDFSISFPNLDGSTDAEDARDQGTWMSLGRTWNEVLDARDEARKRLPVEPDKWDSVSRHIKAELKKRYGAEWEDRLDSPDLVGEWSDTLYEQMMSEEGVPCIWSTAYDTPTGGAQGQMQLVQGERMQNQQFRQEKKQEEQQQAQAQGGAPGQEPGADPSQGQGPQALAPGNPMGAPGAMPGAPEEAQMQQMQAQQMQGQPDGTQPEGARQPEGAQQVEGGAQDPQGQVGEMDAGQPQEQAPGAEEPPSKSKLFGFDQGVDA